MLGSPASSDAFWGQCIALFAAASVDAWLMGHVAARVKGYAEAAAAEMLGIPAGAAETAAAAGTATAPPAAAAARKLSLSRLIKLSRPDMRYISQVRPSAAWEGGGLCTPPCAGVCVLDNRCCVGDRHSEPDGADY